MTVPSGTRQDGTSLSARTGPGPQLGHTAHSAPPPNITGAGRCAQPAAREPAWSCRRLRISLRPLTGLGPWHADLASQDWSSAQPDRGGPSC